VPHCLQAKGVSALRFEGKRAKNLHTENGCISIIARSGSAREFGFYKKGPKILRT
jgi:hypothetical protein